MAKSTYDIGTALLAALLELQPAKWMDVCRRAGIRDTGTQACRWLDLWRDQGVLRIAGYAPRGLKGGQRARLYVLQKPFEGEDVPYPHPEASWTGNQSSEASPH